MSLQKQSVDIPLGVGVDQKTDSVWTQAGKLIASNNTRVLKAGEVRHRSGTTEFTHISGEDITGLADVNGELVYTVQYASKLYKQTNVASGLVSPAAITSVGLPQSNLRVLATDIVYCATSDLYCVAWILETGTSLGDVMWTYLDATTYVPIMQAKRLTTSNDVNAIRLLPGALEANLIYSKTGDKSINGVTLDRTGVVNSSTTVNISTNIPRWDFAYRSSDGKAYGVIVDGVAPCYTTINPTGWTINQSFVTEALTLLTVTKVAAGVSASHLFVAYCGTVAGPAVVTRVACATQATTPVEVFAAKTLTSHTGTGGIAIGRYVNSNDSVLIASNRLDHSTRDYLLNASQVDTSGNISSRMFNYRAIIAGKPFYGSLTSGSMFIPVTLLDYPNEYGCGMLLNYKDAVTSGVSMFPAAVWAPRELNVYETFAPMNYQSSHPSTGGTVVQVSITSAGAQKGYALDFSSRTRHVSAKNGALAYIAGSLPVAYDGVSTRELAPLQLPRLPNALVADGGGSGALSSGNYAYVYTYRWVDSKGIAYESAPSSTSEGRITGLAASHKVTLTIPTLNVTLGDTLTTGNYQKTEIVVYRTAAGGTVYYRCSAVPTPSTLLNDTQVATISYTDNMSDATLVTQPILYTQGGALGNDYPPYATALTSWKGRLWLASGSTLWYSKVIVSGEAPGFSDALTIEMPSQGRITALFSIDDKLIISTSTSMYMLVGDGPTDAGANSDYPDPVLVSDDVGVADPRGVVTGPFGALFGSKKGLYQLDRAMAVAYAGSKAEATWLANSQITSACRAETESVVYFGANPSGVTSGVRIVYDYALDIWSYDTIDDPVNTTVSCCFSAMCEHGGKLYFGTSGQSSCYIGYENSAVQKDWTTQSYVSQVETPWVHVAGIAGFQRVWRATLTGYRYTDCEIAIYVAKDYIETYETNRTWVYSDISAFSRLQLSVKPTTQKCEAIKIKVTGVTAHSATTAPAFGFSAITLELGVKGAAKRLPAGQRK